MAEEFLEAVRADIERAEKARAAALDMIARLRRAGEDVTELERNARRLQARIERYKRAFAE